MDFYGAQLAAMVQGAVGKKNVKLADYLMMSRIRSSEVKLSVEDLGKALEAMSKQGVGRKKGSNDVSLTGIPESIPKRGRNRLGRRSK